MDDTGVPVPRGRPNVLALPPPSLVRFALITAVLLVTGSFAGTWLYLVTARDDYVAAAADCADRATTLTTGLDTADAIALGVAIEEACMAPTERHRAAYQVGGVLAVGFGSLWLMFIAPIVQERRRKLVPLPERMDGVSRRTAELAATMGLRRVPDLRLGPAELTDAFAYGRPAHYRIAVPRALVLALRRDRDVFDAIISHELAHVRHGDVAWSKLACSVWYVVAPALAAPAVTALANTGGSLLPDYMWRAALLAAAVHLVMAATLRAREHDADLRAARATSALTRRLSDAAPRHDASRWRLRWLARHPVLAERLAVLEHPQLSATATFTDGLTGGFLAALAVPLLGELLWTSLTGTAARPAVQAGAALAGGALLGLVVGLTLIRTALGHRAVGAQPTTVPIAIGVGLGVPAGQVVSLAGAGTGEVADAGNPAWLLASFCLAVGATFTTAALATLLADAAGRAHAAFLVWLPIVIAGAAAYGAAIWLGMRIELLGDTVGVEWLLAWAVTALHSPVVLPTAAVFTAVAASAALAGGSVTAPAWLVDGPIPDQWAPPRTEALTAIAAGLAAGLAGAVVVVVNRVARGEATTEAVQLSRYYTVVWVGAAAAMSVMVVLSVLSPQRGPALAAVGGPAAVGGVLAGLVAVSAVQGSMPSLSAVVRFCELTLALGATLGLIAAGVAATTRRAGPLPPRVAVPVAALLSATAAAALVLAPDVVVPDILLSG